MLIYLSMIETEADKRKFIALYETYRSSMFYSANKILNNADDAEDAVHQTFLKIAETIETVDDSVPGRVKGLLLTITRHYAIDLYRKKQKRSLFEAGEVEDIAVIYETSGSLAKCMAKLPEAYRAVIVLKYNCGYSTREISRLLSLSVSNVNKIHQRAKRKLGQLCEEEGIL